MFVYGKQKFGKVNHTHSGAFVATEFYHINVIPLLPANSCILHRFDRMEYILLKLPIAIWKSILMAWFRAALMCLLFAASGFLIACYYDHGLLESYGTPSGLVFGTGLMSMILSYVFAHGTPETVLALAKQAGCVDPQVLDVLRAPPANARSGGPSTPTAV